MDAELTPEELASVRPTAVRRFVTVPFWAGMLGGGVALWVFALLYALHEAELLRWFTAEMRLAFGLGLGLVVAMMLGFREPVRSYKSLFGRLVGVLVYGFGSVLLLLLPLLVLLDGSGAREANKLLVVLFAGAVWAGLALLRLHGIGVGRRRIAVGVGVAAVLLVSVWPSSPRLRCRIGFAEGCTTAADELGDRGDLAGALAYAERGCSRDDGVACRLGGQAAEAQGSDLGLAEGFYRRGCALGDATSCERIHQVELEKACDRWGAFACAELARIYERGTGPRRPGADARQYYRKACLFGADEACAQGGP